MDAIAHLRHTVDGEVLDYQTVLHALHAYRKPRDKLTALLAAGDLLRVKKGLYVFGDAHRRRPFSRELLANLVYGPSYVSLDYALAHYGMIPERVEAVTSVTTGKRRIFHTPLGEFTYTPLSLPRYGCGIDRIESGPNMFFLMATREKALLDKVWCDKRPRSRALDETWSYLVEDLRIDPETLGTLCLDALDAMAARYGSAKVFLAVRCLKRMGETVFE